MPGYGVMGAAGEVGAHRHWQADGPFLAVADMGKDFLSYLADGRHQERGWDRLDDRDTAQKKKTSPPRVAAGDHPGGLEGR